MKISFSQCSFQASLTIVFLSTSPLLLGKDDSSPMVFVGVLSSQNFLSLCSSDTFAQVVISLFCVLHFGSVRLGVPSGDNQITWRLLCTFCLCLFFPRPGLPPQFLLMSLRLSPWLSFSYPLFETFLLERFPEPRPSGDQIPSCFFFFLFRLTLPFSFSWISWFSRGLEPVSSPSADRWLSGHFPIRVTFFGARLPVVLPTT